MLVQSYLFFDGRCEEALDFYKSALGAEVTMLMRHKDSPEPAGMPAGDGNKIMHAAFRIGDTLIMASDGHCAGNPVFQGFALSIAADGEADANRIFAALSDGGNTVMPLSKTFFSPCFGMVTDRFGVTWMIIVSPEPA